MKKKMLISFFLIVLIVAMFAAVPMIAYADVGSSQTEDEPTEEEPSQTEEESSQTEEEPSQTEEESTEPDDSTNVGILIVADDPNVGISTIGDNANIDVSTSGDADVMINGEHVQQTVINTTTQVYEGVGKTTVRKEIDAKLFELIYPRLDLSEATFGQLLPLIGPPADFYSNFGTSNMAEVLINNTNVISALEEEMLNNYSSMSKELEDIKSKNKELEALILVSHNEPIPNEPIPLTGKLESTLDELKAFKITTYIGMAFLLLLFLTYVILKRVRQNQED